MITGSHVLLYSQDPEADRAFFRDVLQFRGVDAGGGWLIFKLPPAEIALHPADAETKPAHRLLTTQFYLMCDDLPSLMKSLEAKKVSCTSVTKERWGIRTTIKLPSGGEIGLYQPTHPTAFKL
jgi:catechol 2,3-dioxygenase-like lactoylglutathione lyase family enzyme